MEYLVVEYVVVGIAVSRRVLVNGNPSGLTNSLIQLEAGTHRIALVPPPDFSPLGLTIILKDTSALAPQRVKFAQALPSSVPPAPGTPA